MVETGMPRSRSEAMREFIEQAYVKYMEGEHWSKGAAAFHRGDDADVVDNLGKVVANIPNLTIRSGMYLVIARSQFKLGDLTAAESALRLAQKCGEELPSGEWSRWLASTIAIDIAFAYRKTGDLSKTRAAYKRVMDIDDPEFGPKAAGSLGALEYSLDGPKNALPLFEYAFTKGARRTKKVAAYNLGNLWDNRGFRIKALRYYLAAAWLWPWVDHDLAVSRTAVRRLIDLRRKKGRT
ncbi:hypothetical protein [Pseudonocardia sp. DLS-67]